MAHNNNTARQDAIATDYAQNMFSDGNNRAESNNKIRIAPEYTRAAHTPSAEEPQNEMAAITLAKDTFHSRDGTDSAGLYDESGGPIGGTEEELDSLEAGYTPVDKNPRMKN